VHRRISSVKATIAPVVTSDAYLDWASFRENRATYDQAVAPGFENLPMDLHQLIHAQLVNDLPDELFLDAEKWKRELALLQSLDAALKSSLENPPTTIEWMRYYPSKISMSSKLWSGWYTVSIVRVAVLVFRSCPKASSENNAVQITNWQGILNKFNQLQYYKATLQSNDIAKRFLQGEEFSPEDLHEATMTFAEDILRENTWLLRPQAEALARSEAGLEAPLLKGSTVIGADGITPIYDLFGRIDLS
jgi:hypothetical protein